MFVVDGLDLPDPTVQLDVQFTVLAILQAQNLEMLGLAARLADRLEPGGTSSRDRNLGICGFVMADGRGGTRKTMIVALARKLLIALWRLVTTGEMLDGIVLRPA